MRIIGEQVSTATGTAETDVKQHLKRTASNASAPASPPPHQRDSLKARRDSHCEASMPSSLLEKLQIKLEPALNDHFVQSTTRSLMPDASLECLFPALETEKEKGDKNETTRLFLKDTARHFSLNVHGAVTRIPVLGAVQTRTAFDILFVVVPGHRRNVDIPGFAPAWMVPVGADLKSKKDKINPTVQLEIVTNSFELLYLFKHGSVQTAQKIKVEVPATRPLKNLSPIIDNKGRQPMLMTRKTFADGNHGALWGSQGHSPGKETGIQS